MGGKQLLSQLVVLSLFLILSLSSVAQTVTSFDSTDVSVSADNVIADKFIEITKVNQEPDPVEPGQYVTVTFKIVNYGSEDTDEITVGIRPQFPFTLFRGQSAEQELGILESRQTGDKSEIFEWDLLVDKDAAEGEATLEVYYKEKNRLGDVVILYEEDFTFDIRTSDAVIDVSNVKTDSEELIPGKESTLSFDVTNLADSFIKDVTVDVDLSDTTLATVGGPSTTIIQRLDGGEKETLSFKLVPDIATTLTVHRIPLTVTFKDNLNTEYEYNTTFGVKVNTPIEYTVYIEDSDITQSGNAGDVTLRLSNVGVHDITFLSAKLLPSEAYDIISTDTVYVGEVESDDYEQMTFKIYVNPDAPSDLPLRLEFEYKDKFYTQYEVAEEVTLPLFGEEQVYTYGLKTKSSPLPSIIFVLVVVGIIGYIFYKRRKRKQRLQN